MEPFENSLEVQNDHVVIVDDEPAVLDALQMLLVEHGYFVRAFHSGVDFLKAMRAGLRIDCLLLDAHLLGVTGAEVAQEAHTLNPRVPIIGMTARPWSALAIATSHAGARVMLTKPVAPEKLLRVIEEAIGKTRKEQPTVTPPD